MGIAEIVALSTSVAALIGVGAQALMLRANAKRGQLDSEVGAAVALGKLLEDFIRLRDELESCREQEEDAIERLRTANRKLDDVKQKLAAAKTRIRELEVDRGSPYRAPDDASNPEHGGEE